MFRALPFAVLVSLTLATAAVAQEGMHEHAPATASPLDRIKARKGGAGNEIAFDFAGGAGIDPARTMHMHSARMAFVDGDHLRSEWHSMDKGKPAHVAVFDLARSR